MPVVLTARNDCDGTSRMSNCGELLSRNSSVVDSATGNVPSAQKIVDKFLQSQKDLENTNDNVQRPANEICGERSSVKLKCKDKRRQNNTE